MDDVRLPMVLGAMDDISQEGESSQDGDTPLDSMSSQVMILSQWSLCSICLIIIELKKLFTPEEVFGSWLTFMLGYLLQGQKAIYEKEARIVIDYSSLDEDLKEVVPIIWYWFLFLKAGFILFWNLSMWNYYDDLTN